MDLCSCAKGNHSDETQEHIHRPLEECIGAKFRPLQPTQQNMDTASLRPWNSQVGCIHPLCDARWLNKNSNNSGCHPPTPRWLARDVVPRHVGLSQCQRSTSQESRGLHQGAALRCMPPPTHHRTNALHPHPIYPQVHRLDGGPEGGGSLLSISADARP